MPCLTSSRFGQAEVLLRRDVAEHRRAAPAGEGGADAAGDVVVAGGEVGHERAEDVERRAVADFDLLLDVHVDLVHRDVAGAFDHDLRAVRPAAVGQFAEDIRARRTGPCRWRRRSSRAAGRRRGSR